jgi:LemA protein
MGLATGIFWGVGLYGRLTRLQVRSLEAFAQLDRSMKSLAQLVQEQIEPSLLAMGHENDPLIVEAHWAELHALSIALEQALKDCRLSPLKQECMAQLQIAHQSLQTAWTALSDLPADLAGSAVPDQVQQQWDAALLKVQAASISLQDVAQSYNESLRQFPARLVARNLGFKPAASIEN